MRLQRKRCLVGVAAVAACACALLSGVDVARAQSTAATAAVDDDSGRPLPIFYGPVDIKLLDQGTLKLPAGYRYVPQRPKRGPQGKVDPTAPQTLGTILSLGDAPKWMMSVVFQSVGHAAPVQIGVMTEAEILENLKNAATNGRLRGSEPYVVKGLMEPPAYDAVAQRMRVAMRTSQTGLIDADGDIIDVTTYLFGRQGILSLKFLTSEKEFTARRQPADAVLAGLSFSVGNQGTDAVAGQDRVVEHPLQVIFGGETGASLKAKAVEAAEAEAAARAEAAAAAAQTALADKQRADEEEASAARTRLMLWGLAAVGMLVIGFFVAKMLSSSLPRNSKSGAGKGAATMKRVGGLRTSAAR